MKPFHAWCHCRWVGLYAEPQLCYGFNQPVYTMSEYRENWNTKQLPEGQMGLSFLWSYSDTSPLTCNGNQEIDSLLNFWTAFFSFFPQTVISSYRGGQLFIPSARRWNKTGPTGKKRDYNASDCITPLQYMASFKRSRMGVEVCLQRIWRWERSAHPDLANCGDTSVTYMGLLFGMSWILSSFWNRLGTGVSKHPWDSAWLFYCEKARLYIVCETFFLRLVCEKKLQPDFCLLSSSFWQLNWFVYFRFFVCFFCPLLGLKSQNCPSYHHPHFLPPQPVPK